MLGVPLYRSNYMEANKSTYINTEVVPTLDKSFTIEFIQRSYESSMYKLNGNNYAGGAFFGVYPDGRSYIVYCGTAVPITSNKEYPVITFSYDSATNILKSYLDGVYIKEALVDATITTSTLPIIILRSYQTSDTYRQEADMRLFKIYDELLTDEQIAENATKYIAQGYTS